MGWGLGKLLNCISANAPLIIDNWRRDFKKLREINKNNGKNSIRLLMIWWVLWMKDHNNSIPRFTKINFYLAPNHQQQNACRD